MLELFKKYRINAGTGKPYIKKLCDNTGRQIHFKAVFTSIAHLNMQTYKNS
jgi:hypothetical protein